jgi:glycosyltransferase involved in cell wall biosynthesis
VTGPLVTVGVPVYRGQNTLPALIECLANQSYRNLELLISIDADDQKTADVCEPLIRRDSRLRMQVQPVRLGWAGNTDWTIRNRRGDFYIYQQHDDWISRTYVEDLVDAARHWPQASICFSTLQYVGARSWQVPVPSVVGNQVDRIGTYLRRLDWVPFRGLIRGSAIEATSGLLLSDFDPFDSLGTEIRFMAELALAGELRFVRGPTYFKHWDGTNLSAARDRWPRSHRLEATACWAAWMIEVAIRAGKSRGERLWLFMAALDRFVRTHRRSRWIVSTLVQETWARASPRMILTQLKRDPVPPGLGKVTDDERRLLLRSIVRRLKEQERLAIDAWLDRSWDALEAAMFGRYGLAGGP